MTDWQLTGTFEGETGQVRWSRLGAGGRDPVVLVHGTPFSSFVWRGVARALSTHYDVYVWDLPGYGSSEMSPGQDVSLAAQGRVFASLLEHWGLDAPAVVAHDFGGAIALRALLLHGSRYRRLALVDPVAVAPWGSPFFRLVRDNADVFESLPPPLHRALVREYITSASSAGLRPAVLDRLVDPWVGESGQPAFYRQIAQADQAHTDEIQPHYRDVDLPVLVCWGGDDTWLPVARGEALVSAIPGSRLHVIPGAGHLVQEDAGAELTAELIEFLRTDHRS